MFDARVRCSLPSTTPAWDRRTKPQVAANHSNAYPIRKWVQCTRHLSPQDTYVFDGDERVTQERYAPPVFSFSPCSKDASASRTSPGTFCCSAHSGDVMCVPARLSRAEAMSRTKGRMGASARRGDRRGRRGVALGGTAADGVRRRNQRVAG